MRILDDTHSPEHYIDVELVKPKCDNPSVYELTKKREYDYRYQVNVVFTANVSRFDDTGMKILQEGITKAIDKTFEKQPELTEEQQEIYRRMTLAKKFFAELDDFVDTDCLVATTIESFINEWATTKDYMIDENFVPALRKFLNEVAE